MATAHEIDAARKLVAQQLWDRGVLRCRRCKAERPISDFPPSSYANGARSRARCRECNRTMREDRRRRRQAEMTPEERFAFRRAENLRGKFGITLDEYGEMLARQDGVCAICRRPERAKGRSGVVRLLAVDHCHARGGVRALLCGACNTGLGVFGDDPSRLRAAAEYLETHAELTPAGDAA